MNLLLYCLLQYCQNLFKRFKSGNFDFECEEQAEASKIVKDEDEKQAGTSKKIDEGVVNTLEVAQPELMSTRKKMFFRQVLLHYYNMKATGFGENYGSINYLSKTFGDLTRAEQCCQYLIKRFKSGYFVFEDVEQTDMLKNIEKLEAMERNPSTHGS